MRSVLLAAALLGGFFEQICSPSQSVFLDQHDDHGGGTGPSDSCTGIVASINVDLESGTEGGVGHVGTPLVFSADPRDAAGISVPAPCRSGAPGVSALGTCVITSSNSIDSIVATPTAPGSCTVAVTFGGKDGTSDPVTVDPAQQADASWFISCHRLSWLKAWPWPPASTCQDPPRENRG